MASSTHFSDAELACRCCGDNACTTELVDALEALRSLVGAPIIITSGYRCGPHNKAVGGASNSEHVAGIAADVKVGDMDAADLYDLALKVPAFAHGGIGIDPHVNYVHVDVRTDGPARWGYAANGKWEHRADLQQDPQAPYPKEA